MRFMISLTALAMTLSTGLAAEDVLIADFEGTNYGQWHVTGDAFGNQPASGTLKGQQDVLGFRGNGLVNSFLNGDRTKGELLSPEFVIEHNHIVFLIGGGSKGVGVELLAGKSVVRSATGKNQEMLSWHS